MWPWYQEACALALEAHGCEVERFGWFHDFRYWKAGSSEPVYHSMYYRLQYRLNLGPTVSKVQRLLLEKAEVSRPEIIWFYNVQLISPRTVRKLRKMLPESTFIQYANDNPFSANKKLCIWGNYLKSIPLFDVHFSYRKSNIDDYIRFGSKSVHLLRSYFIPNVDFPVDRENIPECFRCDVVFAGHYEDDGRVELLEAIIDAGHKLNLYGGGWAAAIPKLAPSSPLRSKYPISPATEENYRYAICGAKVALCFLSSLNRDSYTRRNFQVPAMKVAMLSQYSDDLASLFEPDKEIAMFRNKTELLMKLSELIKNDDWRNSIAESSYSKVYASGHDVFSRMKCWLKIVSSKIDGISSKKYESL